jgi:ATP-binding cassette, subfamily B (MDR/TAP), member 1
MFFSGFIIAYIRSWKLALVLSCILPFLIIVGGGGGRMVGKASKGVMAGYASAATIAEEVLSSIRTAQAFGTEDRLASTYDEHLAAAQVAGYMKAFAMALLMAGMFSSRFAVFGLGFCIFKVFGCKLIYRGGVKVDCVGRSQRRSPYQCYFRCSCWLVFSCTIDATDTIFY